MNRSLGILCLAAGLVSAGLAHAQDGVKLRYKFKEGDQSLYRKTASMTQVQKVRDQKVETEISGTEVTLLTVQKVDADGDYHIQTENKQLLVKVKIGPLGEYTFDSKSDQRDKASALGGALDPVYDRLNGALFTLVVSPQGKVKELQGYAELMKGALQNNPLAEQFTGGGSDKAAKENFGDIFPALGEEPVRPGDRWEVPLEMNLPKIGTAKGKKIYICRGADTVGDCKTLKFAVNSEMSFDLDIETGGVRVTGTLSITKSDGTVQFDPAAGRVVRSDIEITLGGLMNLSVNGMDIPVETSQTQRTSVELLSKLPE